MQLQSQTQVPVFPLQLLIQIAKYLPFSQVFNLSILSRLSCKLVRSKQFQKQLFCRTLNLNFFKTMGFEVNEEILYEQIKRGCCEDVMELPFWGEATDGGILNNNLRFWIGKTFMKSHRPTVVLNRNENCRIVGFLADNYYQFLHNLLKADSLHHLLDFGQPKPPCQQTLNIYNTFLNCFQNSNIPGHQQYREARKQLLMYVMNTARQLENQDDEMNVTIASNRLKKFACVFSVEISRCLSMAEFNVMEEVLVLTKGSFPLTEISQVRSLLFQRKDFWEENVVQTNYGHGAGETGEEYSYAIFKKNPLGILVWLNMKNVETVHLEIPMEHRPWTNVVNLYLLKSRQTGMPSSLALEYCSFRGIMISNIF